jgi:hypothetical protein
LAQERHVCHVASLPASSLLVHSTRCGRQPFDIGIARTAGGCCPKPNGL